MADQRIDLRGLKCPLPVLKTKKALSAMPKGGTLEVKTSDCGSVKDFEAFCRTTGTELVERDDDGTVFRFVLRQTA